MPVVLNVSERERGILVEALRLLPDVDANGQALVWLASHFFEVHRHNERRVPI